MDLFLCDSIFNQQSLIDYDSLIWTDRYCAYGSFELNTPWTPNLARNLRSFKYLRQPESSSVMMVETAILERPSENPKESLVKVTGRSLEAFLENRSNLTYNQQDVVLRNGRRSAMVNDIVDEYLINGPSDVNDIPNMDVWDLGLTDPVVELTIERGQIYQMIVDLLQPINLGFRIYLRPITVGEGLLRFEVYEGNDWTVNDASLNNGGYKEFSPDEDNLTDISTLESIANYKNHARMLGAKTGVDVYLPNIPPTVGGFERRTLVVEAKDIGADSTTTVAEDQAALRLRGLEILNSPDNKYYNLVDGEAIFKPSEFIGSGLGDVVWIQDMDGLKSRVRIAEKVWTSDATGDKLVPTFEAVTDG